MFRKARARIENRRAKRVVRIVGPHVHGRTLDVGSWNGDVARRLTAADVVGIDVAKPDKCAIPVTLFDGCAIPFGDQEFDTVLFCFILHHAEQPDRLMSEARRVGKRIVVLEDSIESVARRWSVLALHEAMRVGLGMPYQADGFRTRRQWFESFASHGLCVDHHSSHGGVLSWPCLRHELFVLAPDHSARPAA